MSPHQFEPWARSAMRLGFALAASVSSAALLIKALGA